MFEGVKELEIANYYLDITNIRVQQEIHDLKFI